MGLKEFETQEGYGRLIINRYGDRFEISITLTADLSKPNLIIGTIKDFEKDMRYMVGDMEEIFIKYIAAYE